LKRPFPAGLALGLAVIALVVAGCGFAASDAEQPSPAITPQASLSPALQICRNELSQVLSAAGLNLVQPSQPYRPAESPTMTSASRFVGQVLLAEDPDHGFIVIYEFKDPATAYAAAQEQAVYIGGNQGRLQFLPDTQFTIRQYGSCVIFYAYSPTASTDPRSPEIGPALETFGEAIPIPG
jgi:hypothetical protein